MELVIGAAIGVSGVLVALWGIWYAHKSYLIAKKAPIVRVGYYDIKRRQITNSVPLTQSTFEFKKDGYSQPIEVPFIVRNIGRLTAKNIQLNVRYPGALKVHSSARRIVDENDPILSMNIVIAHKVPHLQPQAQVLIKDAIEIPKYFFEGLTGKVHTTSKDGIPIQATWRAEFDLIVECVLFYNDSLPTYASVTLFDKDKPRPTKEPDMED